LHHFPSLRAASERIKILGKLSTGSERQQVTETNELSTDFAQPDNLCPLKSLLSATLLLRTLSRRVITLLSLAKIDSHLATFSRRTNNNNLFLLNLNLPAAINLVANLLAASLAPSRKTSRGKGVNKMPLDLDSLVREATLNRFLSKLDNNTLNNDNNNSPTSIPFLTRMEVKQRLLVEDLNTLNNSKLNATTRLFDLIK
jgi:hypothetical protein